MARKVLSVVQAAEQGSRLDALKALRDRVAQAIEADDTPTYALSALVRTQMDLLKDIEALEGRAEVDAQETKARSTDDTAFKLEVI